jgi:hypothetical protein
MVDYILRTCPRCKGTIVAGSLRCDSRFSSYAGFLGQYGATDPCECFPDDQVSNHPGAIRATAPMQLLFDIRLPPIKPEWVSVLLQKDDHIETLVLRRQRLRYLYWHIATELWDGFDYVLLRQP